MDTFTDYYEVLGVDARASGDTIKAAFKKLALQYHPDVYKGEDAQERMRLLLLAYQTLSDPEERRIYDRQRVQRLGLDDGASNHHAHSTAGQSYAQASSAAKQAAHDARFAFPDLNDDLSTPANPVEFTLEGCSYTLWPDDARLLRQQGMLRGSMAEPAGLPARSRYFCHRCHARWNTPGKDGPPAFCPTCQARDWADFLLLRCQHCHAVFESRDLRDKLRDGQLYNPYELFPLCPNCRRPQWCPAEDARVYRLQAAEARRRAILVATTLIVTLVLIGVIAVAFAR